MWTPGPSRTRSPIVILPDVHEHAVRAGGEVVAGEDVLAVGAAQRGVDLGPLAEPAEEAGEQAGPHERLVVRGFVVLADEAVGLVAEDDQDRVGASVGEAAAQPIEGGGGGGFHIGLGRTTFRYGGRPRVSVNYRAL